jgi:hypothetical protein
MGGTQPGRGFSLRSRSRSPPSPLHASGYAVEGDGRLVDTTAMHAGKFADGAIVTNAREEAAFLRAAMNGTLFPKRWWLDLYGAPASSTGCAGPTYVGSGLGDGYRSQVWYDDTGNHLAVLLLNGRTDGPREDEKTAAATLRLFCAAAAPRESEGADVEP